MKSKVDDKRTATTTTNEGTTIPRSRTAAGSRTATRSRNERRDALESRCRILNVARRLFGECGVQAVSMHQIAKSAGIGQGTLYRKYAHKGALCLDLLKDSTQHFLQETSNWLQDSHTNLTALEQIDGLVVRLVEFIERKGQMMTTVIHECHGDIYQQPIFQRLHETVSTLFVRAVDQGEIDSLDPILTADALLASLSPALYLFQTQVRGYQRETIIDGVRRIYTQGLRRERSQIG